MKSQWLEEPARGVDEEIREAAAARQLQLTKPVGSLGRLEGIAVRLAGLQGRDRPAVERVRIVVFAADHGIAEEGVSLFPQAVTTEMIRNFARGGAAIAVAARHLGAGLEVVDVGAVHDPGPLPGVVAVRVAPGTANFTREPAMSGDQLTAVLDVGREAVARAQDAGADLFVGGEMGIGNTTTAAAVASAILGDDPALLAGSGTGVDERGVARKAELIGRALRHHGLQTGDAWGALCRVGGFEIAALTGAYIAAAQAGIPVLVDGFICGAAALAALRLNPAIEPWLFYAHASAESGHRRLLDALSARPLLDLDLRLGEGSGAAAAVPLMRLACALHNGMATFAEAGVSESHG